MAFPTTSVLDDFNRTDASPIDGNWTKLRTTDFVRIASNIAENYNTTYGGSAWTSSDYDRSVGTVEVYLTIRGSSLSTGTYTVGITWGNRDEGTSNLDHYLIEWSSGGTLILYLCTNSSWDPLKTMATGLGRPVSGYRIGATHDSSGLITAYYDAGAGWVNANTHTDTTLTTGKIGIWGYVSNGASGKIGWDDFGGGYLVSASAALPRRALDGPIYGSLRGSVR